MNPELCIVPEAANGMRADKFLAQFYAGQYSRTQIQKCFKQQNVYINGQCLKIQDQKIFTGDRIDLTVPNLTSELKAQSLPVAILYEDSWIIAVNKPSGQVVHPGHGTSDNTLVHALLSHGPLSIAGGSLRPGVVHRLDKETSGIILFAKTDDAYFSCIKMFANRQIKKTYYALVEGIPTVKSGTIDANIGRHRFVKTKMTICRDEGKPAVTHWYVEKIFPKSKCSMLICEPLTGRTHQIRLHLKHIGHPIIGDRQYGNINTRWSAKRVLLHAFQLKFNHPITQSPIVLSAPLPEDFENHIKEFSR